jgi:membrane protease YdiL (CAAX protease family)
MPIDTNVSAPHATPQQHSVRALEVALAIGLTVMWLVLIDRFGQGDVYSVMGPYACVVLLVCIALRPRDLAVALRPTWGRVLSGLAVGVIMSVLTYPAFQLARQVVPQLDGQVQSLYHGARSTSISKALPWLMTIGLAEELLFRGLFPIALEPWRTRRHAYTIALIAYVVAQLGTGSWIVALLALVCGCVWSLLCVRSGSLLPSVIAHSIWSPTLILLYPVN